MMRKCARLSLCLAAAILLLAAPLAADDSCLADSSWVNDPKFMDEVPDGGTAFCSFHQFAWNNFLYLIENDNYQEYMPQLNVFVESGSPSAWQDGMKWPATLGQITKEAGSDEPLVAQNGTTVQFSVRMNRTYYDYITDNDLYITTNFNDACTTINAPWEGVDPNDSAGSVELKTAWLEVDSCDSSEYVCMDNADVGKVALLGFHLVQKTADHQEWIWASFEHVSNAPDCEDLNETPPAPFTSWALFNGDFTPCDAGSCSTTDCQPHCNDYQEEGPSNVCREVPIEQDGTTSTGGGPLVASLNASVHSLLTNPDLTVLDNYELVGTIWFKPGLTSAAPVGAPNPPDGQQYIGSVDLSNTTMETFTQGDNCFTCHVAGKFKFKYNASGTGLDDLQASIADLSHIYKIRQGPDPGTACNSASQSASSAAGELEMAPSHPPALPAAAPAPRR